MMETVRSPKRRFELELHYTKIPQGIYNLYVLLLATRTLLSNGCACINMLKSGTYRNHWNLKD
jgi:hypothetical protein